MSVHADPKILNLLGAMLPGYWGKASYLGGHYPRGESTHIGPLWEIRRERDDGSEPPRWGVLHHAPCAGGYRVPVLFVPYQGSVPVQHVLIAVGFVAWAWRTAVRNVFAHTWYHLSGRAKRDREAFKRVIEKRAGED